MQEKKIYSINEIFESLQGEGYWTGCLAIFIRFAFCNLKCSFCDTDFSKKYSMTVSQILEKLKQYKSKRIILTGGEPTLQIDIELIKSLIRAGYKIHIETNGTKLIHNDISIHADWITVSPKENWKLKSGSELKLIYQGQNIKELDEIYNNTNFCYYYLQPCSMQDTTKIISLIKENPIWRLSLQIQKYIKIK